MDEKLLRVRSTVTTGTRMSVVARTSMKYIYRLNIGTVSAEGVSKEIFDIFQQRKESDPKMLLFGAKSDKRS